MSAVPTEREMEEKAARAYGEPEDPEALKWCRHTFTSLHYQGKPECYTLALKINKVNPGRGNYRIGLCYKYGIGVEKNVSEAAKYFSLASDKNVWALWDLALLYEQGYINSQTKDENGKDVFDAVNEPKDELKKSGKPKAFDLFWEAKERGMKHAKAKLAEFYENCKPEDLSNAEYIKNGKAGAVPNLDTAIELYIAAVSPSSPDVAEEFMVKFVRKAVGFCGRLVAKYNLPEKALVLDKALLENQFDKTVALLDFRTIRKLARDIPEQADKLNNYLSQKGFNRQPRSSGYIPRGGRGGFRGGRGGRRGPTCYKCGEFGHVSRDCPHEAPLCFSCHKPGHSSRECPLRKA